MSELRSRKRHEPDSAFGASDTKCSSSGSGLNEADWKLIDARLTRIESDIAKLPTQSDIAKLPTQSDIAKLPSQEYFDQQFDKFPSMKLEMIGYIERGLDRGFEVLEDKLNHTLE